MQTEHARFEFFDGTGLVVDPALGEDGVAINRSMFVFTEPRGVLSWILNDVLNGCAIMPQHLQGLLA